MVSKNFVNPSQNPVYLLKRKNFPKTDDFTSTSMQTQYGYGFVYGYFRQILIESQFTTSFLSVLTLFILKQVFYLHLI